MRKRCVRDKHIKRKWQTKARCCRFDINPNEITPESSCGYVNYTTCFMEH